MSAAVYAARKRLSTVLIAEELAGQSAVSESIENWIGTPRISGADLAKACREHLEQVRGDMVRMAVGERAEQIERIDRGWRVHTNTGADYEGRALLITSGARRRKLDIPGADKFENKGISYCASCDGPMFSGQDLVVVGGGNAGFETAMQLLAYAKSVTLIHRHKDFKADAITVEKVCAHPNIHVLRHAEPVEIIGEQFVSGLTYRDKETGETHTLATTGIFVEAGVIPNTDFARDLVDFDDVNRIKVDARNQRTSIESIWAAGDCTNELYHQNNIAAGDGVKALEDIYLWLKTH